MNRQGHYHNDFFLGKEVELTPALGLKTLFVVGLQSSESITAMLCDPYMSVGGEVTHIYFGANHSFDPQDQFHRWESVIGSMLDRGYWCTLDFDVKHTNTVAQSSLNQYNTFIPMISVKMPHTQRLNYNTVVKIDDIDFAATNPGVWCHSLHELRSRDNFTVWGRYRDDEVLA